MSPYILPVIIHTFRYLRKVSRFKLSNLPKFTCFPSKLCASGDSTFPALLSRRLMRLWRNCFFTLFCSLFTLHRFSTLHSSPRTKNNELISFLFTLHRFSTLHSSPRTKNNELISFLFTIYCLLFLHYTHSL